MVVEPTATWDGGGADSDDDGYVYDDDAMDVASARDDDDMDADISGVVIGVEMEKYCASRPAITCFVIIPGTGWASAGGGAVVSADGSTGGMIVWQ